MMILGAAREVGVTVGQVIEAFKTDGYIDHRGQATLKALDDRVLETHLSPTDSRHKASHEYPVVTDTGLQYLSQSPHG